MTDIREGMANDPYRETLSQPDAELELASPPGSDVVLHDDGSMSFDSGEVAPARPAHFANLAETVDPGLQGKIAQDLLDAIEIDKESRERRDTKYAEGLRRTGLGDDAPGGAPFQGASRAVHPMMTEAVVDYSARVQRELLPADGPCKATTIGKPTVDKNTRAERVARYMNYQLTDQMQSVYSELEIGFTQQALSGVFYTKFVVDAKRPSVEVVHDDEVLRPWNGGDFYSLSRITHRMRVDHWEYEDNVEVGLWKDVLDPTSSTDIQEPTAPEVATDKIIGRDEPSENIDEVRTVYEVSTFLTIEDGKRLPYLVTIDEQTEKVLAIYRNWREKDPNKTRIPFLIEWPFQPWRGGYPIGFAHMIGSLSGAASGALRALLDAALLNTMQTGVKLKGGNTAGGQNIRPQPGSTTEMQGSLATDPDIRKTYMQLMFPEPSPVLFQLLGLLIDAGRGVVRTTFDEFSKMTNEMPVGTANMMIDQGLTTYGMIFARQHRAMRRFLQQLWYINQDTVENEQVVDQFGELIVSREDFTGPMSVIPVSDPRIFTDAQRMAGAQLLASRAQMYVQAGQPMYKLRDVEIYLLNQAKLPQPEQFLQDQPTPQQINAAAENVAATKGLPIAAFPGQDHEAHIAQHAAFLQMPLLGSNPVLALKFLPPMLQHIADHMALWYADAMLMGTNAILQRVFHDPRITLEALQTVSGLEVQLDRLMAELTPPVLLHMQQHLSMVMPILQKAQMMIKQLQPPQPMDPSIVAQQDVERQTKKDQADIGLKQQDQQQKTQVAQATLQQKDQHKQMDTALEARQQDITQQTAADQAATTEKADADKAAVAAAGVQVKDDQNQVTLHTNAQDNATKLEVTDRDNATALAVAAKNAEAKKAEGNLKDGKGLQK